MTYKKTFLSLILLLAVGAIVGTVAYRLIFSSLKHYSGYEILAKADRGSMSNTKYFEADGKMMSYNHEGVLATDSDLSVLWNAGISYKNPKVVTGGKYIAMADIGGKSLSFIHHESTPVNVITKEMPGTIHDLSISKTGQVAVLLSDKKSNLIQILSPLHQNEEVIAEIKVYQAEDGYGLNLAISPDGAKLVTEFIKREGGDLKTTLTFYNFGNTGEGTNADRIVGIFPYKDTIFGKLAFLTDNHIVAVGDNKIVSFSMKHEPKLIYEKKLHGTISKVSGDESGLAMILIENGQKMQAEQDEKEEIEFVDEDLAEKTDEYLIKLKLSGDRVFARELDKKHTELAYKKGETILHSEAACIILNSDGSEKFVTGFQENILKIFPTSKKDKYFLVTGGHIMIIKLNG